MTEIPEHLLKRSRERRAQLTGGTADSGEATTSDSAGESAPATPATATPAEPMATGPAPRAAAKAAAEAPRPEPDSPVVAAAKSRKRIPYWAVAALSLMPLWGFMYVRALTEEPETAEGPLAVGTEVYGSCASCHGGSGEGGTGRPFAEGEVLETFPNIEDQLRFVYFGSEAYAAEGINSYGDPNREGGPHEPLSFGTMPAQETELTAAEILGVVCHERYDLSGADPTSEDYQEEYENWCSEESLIFAALEAEEFTLPELGPDNAVDVESNPLDDAIAIGDVPIEGSSAGG